MLCKKLSHAAYRCRDAKETVAFYTENLGLKFVQVMGADHVPSTQQYDPHIHIFLELEDGSCIAFFEAPNSPGGMKDEQMNSWIQHFAFEVADEEALTTARARLEANGVEVLGTTDHHGFFRSIYFFDPSGHRLELTRHTASTEMMEEAEREAYALLDVWDRNRTWAGTKLATA